MVEWEEVETTRGSSPYGVGAGGGGAYGQHLVQMVAPSGVGNGGNGATTHITGSPVAYGGWWRWWMEWFFIWWNRWWKVVYLQIRKLVTLVQVMVTGGGSGSWIGGGGGGNSPGILLVVLGGSGIVIIRYKFQ